MRKGKIVTDERRLDERSDTTEYEAAAEAEATADDTTAAEPDPIVGDDVGGAELPPQYGVGPFSIREVALGVAWLVAFVVSFFSVNNLRFESVWTAGISWILTIALPTVAVFLIALRRLSPEGIRRVGSLGIDQFASVAFSVSAAVWLMWIWETVSIVAQNGPWVRSWVMWVSFAAMIAGVVFTVFGPLIPPFSEDFRGRQEVVAQRVARPTRPVSKRPAPERRPASAESSQSAAEYAPAQAYSEPDTSAAAYAGGYSQGGYGEQAYGGDAYGSQGADAAQEWAPAAQSAQQTSAVRYQAFWALVPEERDVVDERGIPLFRIGPTAWALVIEDRGETFVVRHEDGRVGYLHDVSGVTRG